MQPAYHEMRFPKIVHIITDLNGYGGTEATLFRYISNSSIPLHCHRVIVLKSTGTGSTLGAQMVAAGIQVIALGAKRGLVSPRFLLNLYRELREFAPDVVSGWLYHPSILASLFGPLLPTRPVVMWHIRCSIYASLFKTPGRFVAQRILSALSRLSHPVMVSNSSVAVAEHAALGFDIRAWRWKIIYNGIDVQHYFPQYDDGAVVRRELGIPENAVLIGCVGRFVPEKGYDVLFDALALALAKLETAFADRVHLLAIGDGVTAQNEAFTRLALGKIPAKKLHLLGKRADVGRILRALDLYVLSSVSEAFPNSLVEAMATGLPCIATNVGECGEVLSAPEFIVPPHDPSQLAACIVRVVGMHTEQRRALGEQNRQCVVARFGLDRMVAAFDTLFRQAAASKHGRVSHVLSRESH